MPIRSRKNQYRGVNAHLHSHFQAHGGWEGFHGNYITFLGALINQALPAGYLINTEHSIQLREFHPHTDEEIIWHKKPDLAIHSPQERPKPAASGVVASVDATLIVPVAATLDLDEASYLRAVVIYQAEPDQFLGRAVAQIEVLSAANKPAASGYLHYTAKREMLIRSGITLLEVDYLHETMSPVQGVPSYPRRERSAYPYTIIVNLPHPTVTDGQTHVYGFAVDDPIPTLEIPLLNADRVKIAFDAAYQQTFESLSAYSHLVDYDRPPENFERYSPADQARIRAVMERVQTAAQQGFAVETQLVPYT